MDSVTPNIFFPFSARNVFVQACVSIVCLQDCHGRSCQCLTKVSNQCFPYTSSSLPAIQNFLCLRANEPICKLRFFFFPSYFLHITVIYKIIISKYSIIESHCSLLCNLVSNSYFYLKRLVPLSHYVTFFPPFLL